MHFRPGIAVLVCAAGLAVAADKVVGGPYVVRVSNRSATVAWVVQSGELKAGENAGDLTRSSPVLRGEKTTLTGLKPGTTYYYDVPGSENLKGQFKTAPSGRASFHFVVFGDTRTRHELHQRVVDAIVKSDPDFVLHTGDLVSDGYDTAQWPVFFGIEKAMLQKTAFYPVLGNHERNNQRFHEFFDVDTPYYSFNWGSAHFVILNSDVGNVSLSGAARDAFWSEQVRWLEDDLSRNQNADFRFVIMHHPPYTVNQVPSHMSKEALALVPLFENHKVTAVFAGHDHNYQHHVKSGIHYVVTGGGGAPLAATVKPLEGMTLKMESVEHFVPIEVEGSHARVRAIALDGHVIDTFEMGRD